MKNNRSLFAKRVLSALFTVSILAGCALPRRPATDASSHHAFIQYWPPRENDKRLRLAVKDIIDMKGVVTTVGSEHFAKNHAPAKRDAKCLAIARQRNVQFVGKTNTTELAVLTSGINEYFGTPRNPLVPRGKLIPRSLIPGGSSSGSAVAVASGLADVAFGTDTSGSIRVPAACCGIVGLKTTFGLVSLDGVYPIAPKHLDTVGPMAKDVAGVVKGMDLLQDGFAARYQYAVANKPSGRQIKVGRLYIPGASAEVDQAVDDALAAAGFKVVKLGESFQKKWAEAQADSLTVAAANAWLHDQQFSTMPGVSLRTKAVFALGQVKYNTSYPDALKRQARWKATLRRQFRDVDFIALPTMQGLPPRIPFFGGTVAFEVAALALQNTAAVNFGGVPALAIPVPVRDTAVRVSSLQLVGPNRSEAALLNAGRLIETASAR